MKTIQVTPAEVSMNGQVLGIVTSINIGGNLEIFSPSVNAWINLIGSGATLAAKNLLVTEGCSESGIDWVAVEADILSQLGLTKAAEQTPAQ
jgi:hypothetical protein